MIHSFHSRSDVLPLDPSTAQAVVAQTVTSQYFAVALATVLVYHSLIIFDKEVKYFWCGPWSIVRVIYFANRCVGLLAVICNIFLSDNNETLPRCLSSIWAGSISRWTILMLIDYILLLRILALYHRERAIEVCLKTLFGSELVATLGMCIYGTEVENRGIFMGSVNANEMVCMSFTDPPTILSIISWSIPMVFGLILLSLVLFKAVSYWRESPDFKGFHLVRILIQDQVIYYTLVVISCTLNIVVTSIYDENVFIANLLDVAGNPIFLCVLGSQFLINLKEAGEKGVTTGTSGRERSISDIQFA